MTNALSLALVSLAAAGGLDVVFKGYSRRERSRGMFVFGCGAVWFFLQFAYVAFTREIPSFDTVTLGYGLVAGVVSVVANILLIESLAHLEVSAGATIYRLNTIGVVILSFFFLEEALGGYKIAGVGLGIIAVILMKKRLPNDPGSATSSGIFLFVVIVASLLRAIFGVVSKSGLHDGADSDGILLVVAFCWVVGGLLYAIIREGRIRLTSAKFYYGLASGVLAFIVVTTLIEALKYGEASVIVPIANLSFVVSLLVSVMINMERLNRQKLGAIGCAVAAIFLLAQVAG